MVTSSRSTVACGMVSTHTQTHAHHTPPDGDAQQVHSGLRLGVHAHPQCLMQCGVVVPAITFHQVRQAWGWSEQHIFCIIWTCKRIVRRIIN
eukprot:scaffold120186_cov19-Tisochrysis_lutea.AAC.2